MEKRLFETKFEALIACRNHWQFMWITGSHNKYDYGPANEWYSSCACCEYDKGMLNFSIRSKKSYCEFCPLRGYAWERYCSYNKKSFYGHWYAAETLEQRQFYAGRMVYACNQAIENYLLNKEN